MSASAIGALDSAGCVLISGGPGSGKSELLHRFVSQLRDAGEEVSYDAEHVSHGWVVVDDAHLLTASVLGDLVGSVTHGRVRVLAAAEPREASAELAALGAVAAREGALHLLRSLSTADVRAHSAATGVTTAGAALIRRRTLGVRAVVEEVLARVGDAAPTDQLVAAVADEVASDWQHRLLRRMDPVTQSVLVLAALRQPVDPATAAEVIGVDVDQAVEALDAARGSGLLSATDVFPGVAVQALRTVAGAARFAELHRASLTFRLRHNALSLDEASLAISLGIDDPRLVESLIDAVGTTDASAAAQILGTLEQAATDPRDRLRVARAALTANQLEVAAAVSDDLLTRCATGELAAEESGFDTAAMVSVAAEVAWSRGHLAHATTLFGWLKRTTGLSGGVDAMIADVATGLGPVADADDAAPAPTGAQVAAQLFRDGLTASLTADYLGAAQQLSQAVTLTPSPPSAHVSPAVWAATMLSLHLGDVAGAEYLAAADGTGLLRRFVGVVGGGGVEGGGVEGGEATAGTPRDRLLLAAAELGAARRAGDEAALLRRWTEFADVLRTPCSDLFALLPLGEIVSAAQVLGFDDQVAAQVAAADRLLASYGNPAAWTTAWTAYRTPADATVGADDSLDSSGPGTDGPLTDREAEVARELLAGFTYREIGERLFISAKTVEHHVSRIRRRLDAGSRSDLLSALRAAGYE